MAMMAIGGDAARRAGLPPVAVALRAPAGAEHPAGNLGARRRGLGLADDAAVEVAIDLAELVAIDRQCLARAPSGPQREAR